MAEVKTLEPPPALYDYVLYYECASKDWKKGAKKNTISGNGSLVDLINWNSTYSYDPDDAGGKTLFGVTESSWKSFVKRYPNKGYNQDLNSMGKQGWFDVIKYYWSDYSNADKSANYACAFALFQMSWGGFSSDNLEKLLNTLKTNADNKEYNFISSNSSYYRKIADATNAYSDPMVAYDYIRKAKSTYLYNISTPDRTNKKYRCGWLTRNTLSFTPYGLYVPVTVSYQTGNLKYESPLKQWEDVAMKWAQENKSGYVKIMDWGASPESIAKMTSNPYNYMSGSGMDSSNSMYGSQNGMYSGYGSTSIGNFTNNENIKSLKLQIKRIEVLNTLIEGSYTPDAIIKCEELISPDKIKGEKY